MGIKRQEYPDFEAAVIAQADFLNKIYPNLGSVILEGNGLPPRIDIEQKKAVIAERLSICQELATDIALLKEDIAIDELQYLYSFLKQCAANHLHYPTHELSRVLDLKKAEVISTYKNKKESNKIISQRDSCRQYASKLVLRVVRELDSGEHSLPKHMRFHELILFIESSGFEGAQESIALLRSNEIDESKEGIITTFLQNSLKKVPTFFTVPEANWHLSEYQKVIKQLFLLEGAFLSIASMVKERIEEGKITIPVSLIEDYTRLTSTIHEYILTIITSLEKKIEQALLFKLEEERLHFSAISDLDIKEILNEEIARLAPTRVLRFELNVVVQKLTALQTSLTRFDTIRSSVTAQSNVENSTFSNLESAHPLFRLLDQALPKSIDRLKEIALAEFIVLLILIYLYFDPMGFVQFSYDELEELLKMFS